MHSHTLDYKTAHNVKQNKLDTENASVIENHVKLWLWKLGWWLLREAGKVSGWKGAWGQGTASEAMSCHGVEVTQVIAL